MGMSYKVYIGPYLVIKNKVIEAKVTMPITCPEHTNEKGQFCSICGSKREFREITVSQEVDLYDIIDSNNLYWTPLEVASNSIWIANTNQIGLKFSNDEGVTSISTEWMETELEKFKERCSEVFKRLDEHEFEYKICFGIISYWS